MMTTLTKSSERAHPLDILSDRLGGLHRVVWGGMAVWFVSIFLGDNLAFIGVVGLFGFFACINHYTDRRTSDREIVSDLQTQYADGEIDLATFEREVELVLDERAVEIRNAVEAVGGVGEATSANIALHYPSLRSLRNSDIDELQCVNGIGPQRAAAIIERLGGE